jgi:hypothetical protein
LVGIAGKISPEASVKSVKGDAMGVIELVLAIIGGWTVVSLIGGGIVVVRREWRDRRVPASSREPEPGSEIEERLSA